MFIVSHANSPSFSSVWPVWAGVLTLFLNDAWCYHAVAMLPSAGGTLLFCRVRLCVVPRSVSLGRLAYLPHARQRAHRPALDLYDINLFAGQPAGAFLQHAGKEPAHGLVGLFPGTYRAGLVNVGQLFTPILNAQDQFSFTGLVEVAEYLLLDL